MLRQSSSRNHRSKKLGPSHSLQAFLLVAVGVWIVYQLTRSYGKQRVVAVETDGKDGEPPRRRLGRKGFFDFAVDQASVDDIAGVRDGSDIGRGDDSSEDSLSKVGDGDEEDQEADEDGGVDSDEDDGLAADEEEDDRDLQSQNGSGEDELKTAHGETQNGLNTSVVPPANATDTVQGGVAVLLANATGGAADGTALTSSGYALKNNTSSDDLSLHGRGTAGEQFSVGSPGVENEKPTNNGSAGENQKNLQISKNGTADSVAGHGISS